MLLNGAPCLMVLQRMYPIIFIGLQYNNAIYTPLTFKICTVHILDMAKSYRKTFFSKASSWVPILKS